MSNPKTQEKFIESLGEPDKELTPIEKATRYVKLIDIKKQIDQKYKEYRQELLELTKEMGVLTLKTEDITISRATRRTVKVTNDGVLKEELELRKIPIVEKTVLDMDYMKPVIDKLSQEGEVIPGLDTFETEYVTVRKTKKKKA